MKPLIYFLCTGNSCRSQMAEGFARAMAGDRFEVASAGIAPTRVNPHAIAVMAEVGIDISRHTSKGIDRALLDRAAVVVTLCGDAEESCPVTPPHVRRLHWPLPDPARAQGTDAEVMAVFREVRGQIGARTRALLDELVDAVRPEEPPDRG
jgi:arsenate reductase